MTAKPDLLPLGKDMKCLPPSSQALIRNYARANVEAATAVLEVQMETWKAKAGFHAELSEALQAEVERIKQWICHNGGLLNEWGRDCPPGMQTTAFVRQKLDAALAQRPATTAQAHGDGELPSPFNGDFDCPKAAAARSCPCGFCRALRTPNAPGMAVMREYLDPRDC